MYEFKRILTHIEPLNLSFRIKIPSLEVLEKMNMQNHLLEKPWWYHLDGSELIAIVEILEWSDSTVVFWFKQGVGKSKFFA
jgi:hypothetical protein